MGAVLPFPTQGGAPYVPEEEMDEENQQQRQPQHGTFGSPTQFIAALFLQFGIKPRLEMRFASQVLKDPNLAQNMMDVRNPKKIQQVREKLKLGPRLQKEKGDYRLNREELLKRRYASIIAQDFHSHVKTAANDMKFQSTAAKYGIDEKVLRQRAEEFKKKNPKKSFDESVVRSSQQLHNESLIQKGTKFDVNQLNKQYQDDAEKMYSEFSQTQEKILNDPKEKARAERTEQAVNDALNPNTPLPATPQERIEYAKQKIQQAQTGQITQPAQPSPTTTQIQQPVTPPIQPSVPTPISPPAATASILPPSIPAPAPSPAASIQIEAPPVELSKAPEASVQKKQPASPEEIQNLQAEAEKNILRRTNLDPQVQNANGATYGGTWDRVNRRETIHEWNNFAVLHPEIAQQLAKEGHEDIQAALKHREEMRQRDQQMKAESEAFNRKQHAKQQSVIGETKPPPATSVTPVPAPTPFIPDQTAIHQPLQQPIQQHNAVSMPLRAPVAPSIPSVSIPSVPIPNISPSFIQNIFGNFFKSIQTQLDNFKQKISGLISNFSSKLTAKLGKFAGRAFSATNALFNKVVDVGRKLLRNGINAIAPGLGTAIGALSDIVRKVTGGMIDPEGFIIKGVMKFLIIVTVCFVGIIILSIIVVVTSIPSFTGKDATLMKINNITTKTSWNEFEKQFLAVEPTPSQHKNLTWQEFQSRYLQISQEYLSLEKQ